MASEAICKKAEPVCGETIFDRFVELLEREESSQELYDVAAEVVASSDVLLEERCSQDDLTSAIKAN